MTDLSAYLDAAQGRADAATPGPWRFLDDPSNTIVADGSRSLGAFSGGPFTVGGTYNYDDPQNDANGTFIAAARTDVPAMVAVLRDIERLCDEWDGYGSVAVPTDKVRAALSSLTPDT